MLYRRYIEKQQLGDDKMILYFTGTGNSRYIARHIADSLGDSLLDMNERIKAWDISEVTADMRLVFVVPTYGWRIPHIVEKWIDETQFGGDFKVWFIMDCGGEIGDADKYIRRLCERKGFDYMGVKQIVMPENYVAMFGVPSPEQAARIIEKAQPDIKNACETLNAGEKFPQPRRNVYDRFMSDIVNPVFYKLFVKADAFTATDKCVGCGKCVKLCPLNNIELKDQRPVWGRNCTHCMACICLCPTEAVEYGKKSVGKPRYHLD